MPLPSPVPHRLPGDPAGAPDPLAACEAPIHAPGSIQPHGALIVIDPARGLVTHASANLTAVFGIFPADALGRPPAEVLGAAAWQSLLQNLPATQGPEPAGAIRVPVRGEGAVCPWVSAAAVRSPCGRLCIELEPRLDERSALAHRPVANPVFTAQSVLTILRSARSVVELCDLAARELRRMTGHDRCMVYRFAADGHGEVVAEDRTPDLIPFLGLHYPAADIPQVARRLYVAQRVRVIPDIGYTPVPLLALPDDAAAAPVDMSLCGLRAVSPYHLEYLRNMDVRATLAVSLFGADGGLWGMIVCHHGTPHAVPPDLRALADLMGQVSSVLIASLGNAESLADQLSRERHLRGVAAAMADISRPITEALASVAEDLLRCTAATGAAARLGGRLLTLGRVPPDAAALIDRLLATGGPTQATDCLASQLPGTEDRADTAAGALVLQLPHGSNDAIAWFRPELAATVTWAGDPRQAVEKDSQTGRVSPRRSFATWRETVRGRSTAWSETDRAAAADIRRIIGDCFVRRAEAELARLRNLDPLTGLPNRRLLQERLDAVAATAATPQPAAAALIYIDLDRFKDVNDSLGHDAGDALLIEIALRLQTHIDPRHLVARIGGDEFAILCEAIDLTAAEAVAEAVRQSLDLPFALAGRPYRATASVGVAHTLANRLTGGTLLQAADAAMYVAKRGGGNAAAHYAEPLRAEITRRFSIEQDLRTALQSPDGGGLMLHFQPVIAGSTGRLEGFEALCRWRLPDTSPEGRMIPPVEFIPVAEAGGLIGELGDWVLDAALDEAVRWAAQLGADERAPYVAVNVSPRQLASGAFQARVTAALAGRGLAADALRVEVTEAAIADLAAGRELACLRAQGVRVAIDDFGTGYSSLSYLRRLPADVVKLDRSFLPGAKASDLGAHAGADEAEADEAFMEAVVGVAHRAGLAVVAEGVETASQLAATVRVGIDSIQGYYFAPPMPAAAVHALLSQPEGAARTGWIKAARHAQAEARQIPGVSRRLERRPSA